MKHILKKGRAIVITGPEGSGKSSLARVIAESCGSYAEVHASDIRGALGTAAYRAFMFDTVIVDEYREGSCLEQLRPLVAADKVSVTRQGHDAELVAPPNFILCTGSVDALKLDANDRRFLVIDMPTVIPN